MFELLAAACWLTHKPDLANGDFDLLLISSACDRLLLLVVVTISCAMLLSMNTFTDLSDCLIHVVVADVKHQPCARSTVLNPDNAVHTSR